MGWVESITMCENKADIDEGATSYDEKRKEQRLKFGTEEARE